MSADIDEAVGMARLMVRGRDGETDPTTTLARAVIALADENAALRAVCEQVVECFDAETLEVGHTEVDYDGPISGRWTEPACGDDNDACSRETCPAIWVVNESARLTGRLASTAGDRSGR